MSLYLAPPDSRLTDAVASEGWLDDEEANLDMGYGAGEGGVSRAYRGFLDALDAKVLFGIMRGNDPVGFVLLKKPEAGLAQFHGCVAPRFRRTALSARAIEAVERTTLGNGTFRLETEVLTRNKRAIRLLKGLRFRPEGVHKARHLMDGKRENTVTLRLLRSEWRR